MTAEVERIRLALAAARDRYDDAWLAEYIRGAVDMNGPLQLPLEVAVRGEAA